jgi:hypothetical protein
MVHPMPVIAVRNFLDHSTLCSFSGPLYAPIVDTILQWKT